MRLLAAFLVISFIAHTGCTTCSTKKVTCPAFDEPLFTQWFPYQDSSKILFKNITTGDTLQYFVAGHNFSPSYETSRGGFENANTPCNASGHIYGVNDVNSALGGFYITYSIVLQDDNSAAAVKTIDIYFSNEQWKAGSINAGGISSSEINSKADSAFNFSFDNGRTYPQVAMLINDTTNVKVDKPYKLFIAKNIGIIGCEMYPSLQRWVLQ